MKKGKEKRREINNIIAIVLLIFILVLLVIIIYNLIEFFSLVEVKTLYASVIVSDIGG